MFKITQRYLAATFIPPFVLSTLFFVSFLLIFQMFRLIKIVINENVSFLTVLELIFHIGVSFLPMAFPLAALFSIIYTMNKMSEDSEIVAMRSFGVTKQQLFAPFLVLGLMISVTIYVLNAELIPYSRSTFRNMVIKLTSDGAMTNIRSESFFTEIPRVTLFAGEVSDDGNQMRDIFIHFRENNNDEQRVIHAQRGALIKRSAGEFSTPTIRMHLERGNMVMTNTKTGEVEKVIFEEYDFPVISSTQAMGFVTKDSMMTNRELQVDIDETKKKFDDFNETLATDKAQITADQKNQQKNLRRDLYRARLQLWTRYNTPIQCLAFIFLGFSLGIKKGRGHSKNSTGLSLALLLGYYAIFFTGVSFIKKGSLIPELGVMLPTMAIVAIAYHYYRKLDWAS